MLYKVIKGYIGLYRIIKGFLRGTSDIWFGGA